MTLSSFLKFVEIQTKLASIIPFIIGTLYSMYRYKSFNLKNFIIMGISLLVFDMATTAINNYIDYKKALKVQGCSYKDENAIVKYGIKESSAKVIIFTLLTVASVLGVILTINTNVIVLLIGIISFLTGILYTFGPVPISRMPLGEVFSGVFMGFVILFLSCYIHIFDKDIISLIYHSNILSISINLLEVVYIFLISIPTITGIANIMLANNICDVEDDILNNRFTLPYYLGRKNSLNLFKILYYIGYIDLVILIILNILPVTSMLVLLTIMPLNKNIKLFCDNPVKSKTFIVAVKNFALINIANILAILMAIILKL